MGMSEEIFWITGASSGIGKAIAELLSEKEYNLLLSSRDKSSLVRTLNGLKKPENATVYPLDISSNEQVENAYKSVSKEHSIGCLINNAGITSFSSAESDSISQIDEIIKTNLLGAVYAIKAVLPGMIERKSGIIINILSVAAIKLFTNSSAYAASKAGLLAYTNVLREEVREHKIKVINLLPGATKTAIWPADALKKYSHRMMSPSDVAAIVNNLIEMNGNIVSEEIVLRPIGGDL